MTLIDKAEALRIVEEYEVLHDQIAALPARGVDVNPKAVRAAFQEGFVAGAQDGWLNNPRMDREWKASRAKKELKR